MLVAMMFASCGDDNGPSIEITSPADGASYMTGETINFSLTASDDMAVTRINFTFDSENTPSQSEDLDIGIISDLTNFVYNVDLLLDANTPAGEFDVTVVAYDADGNTDEDSIKVTVQ